MGFNFQQLIGALYDNGSISYEDEYPAEGNSAYLWLQCNPSCSMFVTLIVEDDRVFLLKELISLPALESITPLLIVQQQANMILEYDSHVGRVCMDATQDEDDEPREITLMYSLVFPTSLDVDSAAQLIAAAGNALTALKDAMEPLESRIVDGRLDSKAACLVPVGQEEETVEITIHPAVQLLKLTAKQRDILLSFLSTNGITLDAFLQTKHLDIFSVVTDECEICMSNGNGCCWQIAKLPITKDIRRAELETLLSVAYETYRSASIFLGISPYKLLRDFVSEVSRGLY